MYEIVDFKAEHLNLMKVHPKHANQEIDYTVYKAVEKQMGSISIFHGNDLITCMGVSPIWEGRGYVWSLMGEEAGFHMVGIHRLALQMIEMNPQTFRRLEAYVDVDFPEARRWIKLLGFEKECVMKNFNPDGTDAELWARYSNG